MKRDIQLNQLQAIGCTAACQDGKLRAVFPEDGEGRLCCVCEGAQQDWSGFSHLVICVEAKQKYEQTAVIASFCAPGSSDEEPAVTIMMGILPELPTVLSIPVQALDSQQMFLKRTPGKMKTGVFGLGLTEPVVGQFAISCQPATEPQEIELTALYLTDAEPAYPLPERKLVDPIGQLLFRPDWPGKTKDEAELVAYLQAEYAAALQPAFPDEWDQYGGWKKKRFSATGYFRTEYADGRWWLVDPEGCAFFSNGVDVTDAGETCRIGGIEKLFSWLPEKDGTFADAYHHGEVEGDADYFNFAVANLIRAFGEQWFEKWCVITKKRMMEWGFNTVGNWSSLAFARAAKLPYVWPLEGFPATEKKVFRDFPDVFSAEYRRNAEAFAQQLHEFAGDPYMIGYFLRNEPQWAFVEGLNLGEALLRADGSFESRAELIRYLKEKYQTIEGLNQAWDSSFASLDSLQAGIGHTASLSDAALADLLAFSAVMIEEYVKVPSLACRAVDPVHLNLGMRYGYISSPDLIKGCAYMDVFSINCYKMNPDAAIQEAGELTDKPVILGEFHFGARDRGMAATGLRAVRDQAARGQAYRYYMEHAAANPYCVGGHYFILNDQAGLGRTDGECFQIGIVDCCHRPYQEFAEAIQATNCGIYAVADGEERPSDDAPQEIPRIGF